MGEDDDDEIVIDTSVPRPVTGIVITYVVLLGLGALLMGRSLPGSLIGSAPLLDLGLGLGLGLALVVASGILRAKSGLFDALEEAVRERLGELRLGAIIVLALLSALAEEVFFRGFLQTELGDLLGSEILGLVITSVGFGLLHTGPVSRFWPWTLFATVCGFLLGWLWIETAGLLAPVLVHFMVNAVNMARIILGGGGAAFPVRSGEGAR
ncbi:MAG: CPBP family intramembrane metalloprotease [Planctomycetes bacterium]|nr:CPBP family intramembrane metalloprotease [Planctomycetota bacterium]